MHDHSGSIGSRGLSEFLWENSLHADERSVSVKQRASHRAKPL